MKFIIIKINAGNEKKIRNGFFFFFFADGESVQVRRVRSNLVRLREKPQGKERVTKIIISGVFG